MALVDRRPVGVSSTHKLVGLAVAAAGLLTTTPSTTATPTVVPVLLISVDVPLSSLPMAKHRRSAAVIGGGHDADLDGA